MRCETLPDSTLPTPAPVATFPFSAHRHKGTLCSSADANMLAPSSSRSLMPTWMYMSHLRHTPELYASSQPRHTHRCKYVHGSMGTVHLHILTQMHPLHTQPWRSDTEAGGLVRHAADGCNHSILWLLSRGRSAWASPLRPRARPRRPRRSPRPPALAAGTCGPSSAQRFRAERTAASA